MEKILSFEKAKFTRSFPNTAPIIAQLVEDLKEHGENEDIKKFLLIFCLCFDAWITPNKPRPYNKNTIKQIIEKMLAANHLLVREGITHNLNALYSNAHRSAGSRAYVLEEHIAQLYAQRRLSN